MTSSAYPPTIDWDSLLLNGPHPPPSAAASLRALAKECNFKASVAKGLDRQAIDGLVQYCTELIHLLGVYRLTGEEYVICGLTRRTLATVTAATTKYTCLLLLAGCLLNEDASMSGHWYDPSTLLTCKRVMGCLSKLTHWSREDEGTVAKDEGGQVSPPPLVKLSREWSTLAEANRLCILWHMITGRLSAFLKQRMVVSRAPTALSGGLHLLPETETMDNLLVARQLVAESERVTLVHGDLQVFLYTWQHTDQGRPRERRRWYQRLRSVAQTIKGVTAFWQGNITAANTFLDRLHFDCVFEAMKRAVDEKTCSHASDAREHFYRLKAVVETMAKQGSYVNQSPRRLKWTQESLALDKEDSAEVSARLWLRQGLSPAKFAKLQWGSK